MRNDGGRTSIFAELNEIERANCSLLYKRSCVWLECFREWNLCFIGLKFFLFSLSLTLCVCVLRILRCLPSIFMEKKRKKLHIIQFAFFCMNALCFPHSIESHLISMWSLANQKKRCTAWNWSTLPEKRNENNFSMKVMSFTVKRPLKMNLHIAQPSARILMKCGTAVVRLNGEKLLMTMAKRLAK